ncbi:MAG TPA: peroxiredoxin, partial [Gaiellaceae bacterium]|nr:peroxiredoxin [Gaiellaceae bacterium]
MRLWRRRRPLEAPMFVDRIDGGHGVRLTERGTDARAARRRWCGQQERCTRPAIASRDPSRGGSVVEEGTPAPEFDLRSDSGEAVRLSDLRGKPVVLYFYPKDDTPGCTTQACGIRDAWGEFVERGAVVLGVSPDDETSHVKFKQKYALPFTLLADPEHRVAEAYGVWVEKSMYGK